MCRRLLTVDYALKNILRDLVGLVSLEAGWASKSSKDSDDVGVFFGGDGAENDSEDSDFDFEDVEILRSPTSITLYKVRYCLSLKEEEELNELVILLGFSLF